MKQVSVIVPVHNEAKHLTACLTAILANDYPLFEVIVVDDGSTDETPKILRQLSDSRLRIATYLSNRGPGAARNAGLFNALGEFVFFIDGDCIPTSQWIRAGVAALDSANVVGVEGPIYYPRSSDSLSDKIPINPFYAKMKHHQINMPGQDYAGGNIAYRRKILMEVGGFRADRYLHGREDSDLGWRLRDFGSIHFAPQMEVSHLVGKWTFRDLLKNAVRYQDDVTFFRDHGFFFFKSGPIVHPSLLALLFWPFAVLRNKSHLRLDDLRFVTQLWLYLFLVRVHIWRAAIKRRTLIV